VGDNHLFLSSAERINHAKQNWGTRDVTDDQNVRNRPLLFQSLRKGGVQATKKAIGVVKSYSLCHNDGARTEEGGRIAKAEKGQTV